MTAAYTGRTFPKVTRLLSVALQCANRPFTVALRSRSRQLQVLASSATSAPDGTAMPTCHRQPYFQFKPPSRRHAHPLFPHAQPPSKRSTPHPANEKLELAVAQKNA
jgi:hypothetical protein